MEAIPRLPMLCFETKSFYPKNAQFGPDLSNLIRDHFKEDPNNYLDEIQQLEKLRQQAAKLNKDVESVATLKRYFCQLYFLQKRFPSLKDLSANNEVTWKDLLSSSNSKKIDYRTELTTTLYNIGILHTQLGACDDRNTDEGLKMACTHFQCAAGAFQYLRNVTSVNARPDFDHGYLEFLISTCLAQAQECIAEKSISDNRKPNTSAKIVAQICEYYQAAKHGLARLVQEDSIFVDSGVKCSQMNLTFLKFKLSYYRSIANLFLGVQAEEEEKMGERVAYFELAVEEFRKARHLVCDITEYPLNKGIDEAMSFVHDLVEGKHKNAVNENNFIYHEEVPPKDKLERVKGASLVNCISFDFNDPDISGPDIFSKLISMKAHELSSVYSEEKAKLLRSVSASVDEKESELNAFLQSFKLDYLDTSEDPNAWPEELIERCAACEAKPTLVQDLIDSMNKLESAHHEVSFMMKEIMSLIEEEEKSEEEFQIVMGTNRPPSIVTTELKCEANRYQDGLKGVTESTESLCKAIAAHVHNIRILSLPLDELEKQLPRVSLEYSPEERNVVSELQRLVDKVEEMKNQRALLMLRLRESLRNDDITDRIVLNDNDKNDFSMMVAKEIGKHQDVVNLIEQNLKAQGNILKAMTNAYAYYAPIRKIVSEAIHKRKTQILALIASFDVSDDVLQNTAKGIEFYRQLETNARKLLSRVKGTCKVQEEERFQMYAKTGKKPPSRCASEMETKPAEKPMPKPAAPKLKDYIAQGRTGKTFGEVSTPYYYTNAVPGYMSPVTRAANPTISGAFYHPSAEGALANGTPETKMLPTSGVKPPVDAVASVPSTKSTTGYVNYDYAYYNASSTAYQPPAAAAISVASNSTNSYQNQHGVPNAYHPAVPYPNARTSTGSHAVGYVGSETKVTYPNAPTTFPNKTPAATHSDSVEKPVYPYAQSSQPPAMVNYGYSNASRSQTSNAYPVDYQVSAYAALNTVASSFTTPPHAYPPAIKPVVYAPYGAAAAVAATATTTVATAAVAPSYVNATTAGPYAAALNPSTYSSNGYASTYARNSSAECAYSQGVSANYAVVDATQSHLKPSAYSAYQMVPGQSAPATATQPPYSYTNDYRYTAPSFGAHSHDANPYLTNFPNANTYSSSFYTHAGPNAITSKIVDGQYYETHYVSSGSPAAGAAGVAEDKTTAAENLYYTSQYGHQHVDAKCQDANAEQFVSRENDMTDRLQAKRNSMTYMQAGRNGNTVSTFSVNAASVTSTEKKEPSNVDLLADLDFNVSDVPLVPTTPAAVKTNELEDSMTSLRLDADRVDAASAHSSGEMQNATLPSNSVSKPEALNSKVECTVSNLSGEKRLLSLRNNQPNSSHNEESIGSEPNKDNLTSVVNSDSLESTNEKHIIDPLSSIDALWPLKKEHC